MADELGDSFHSFAGSSSSSSFRILNAESELPRTTRTISAPSGMSDTQAWGSISYSRSSDQIRSRRDTGSRDSLYGRSRSPPSTVRGSTISVGPSAPPQVAPMPPPIPESKPCAHVTWSEVWRDILTKSDGRDKAFVRIFSPASFPGYGTPPPHPQKLIQYTIRVYLWFHARTISHLGREFNKRLKSVMSGLSLVRKCLIMFNWLTPLIEITNPPPLPYSSLSDSVSSKRRPKRSLFHRLLHASPPTLIDLFNGIADDTYTWHRLGLIPTRYGRQADRIANWLWFLATLGGLIEVQTDAAAVSALMSDLDTRIYDVELDPKTTGRAASGTDKGLRSSAQPNRVDLSVGVEEASEGLRKLKKQSFSLKVTRMKLLMDLVFVSFEVFRWQRYREPAMAFSGLASAVFSSYKIYDKNHANIAANHLLDDGPV